MSKQILAAALCRVSSLEQLKNNSLGHQKDNVLKAAESLGAVIPSDGIWEGQASSKVGVNFNRKDLVQIFEYCKKHTSVKYVIVQEVDRFMRSPEEQTYWYVRFWYELKVRIWFADKPELNEQTHVASLLRYMEGWRAAGSNEERKNKSINGQTAALKDGRYPFAPKPGYKRGSKAGIQEVHEIRGSILKETLLSIVNKRVTPTTALIEFNKSGFMLAHSPYKMDKFRKIVTDPFYAGIVEINKQVKFRNENGLHEPLITKAQHNELIKIMEEKKITQTGPNKSGNPKYPISNLLSCDDCKDSKNGRFVGVDITNGKVNSPVYEKYRCRSCNKFLTRSEVHSFIEQIFKENAITEAGLEDLVNALKTVWKQREGEEEQESNRLAHQIRELNQTIMQQVEAATDPSNRSIKEEILSSIDKKKKETTTLEDRLDKLKSSAEEDKEDFLRFAFYFVDNMGSKFLDISKENRLRCKQVVFPAGFRISKQNKVYTPEMSHLFRLATTKKDTKASLNSHLVQHR